MKKFLKIFTTLCLIFCLSFVTFSCKGCQKENADNNGTTLLKVNVVSPDGAPALSLAKMMVENARFGADEVNYTIVNSNNIASYVQGDNVDIAILPLNAATKFLSAGNKYKLAGVTTHGNLYMLGKDVVTDPSTLIGKKIAVMQYNNVPGLTLRAILEENEIPYTLLGSANDEVDTSKVNLFAVDNAQDIAGNLNQNKADYGLTAEPASSMLAKNLSSKGIVKSLDIQKAYKDTFGYGYPQAVTIVKSSLIESNPKFVADFLNGLKANDNFMTESNIESILQAISTHTEEGYQTTLNATNLTADSMTGCNVKFEYAKDLKTEINGYIDNITQVDSTKISTITDEVYYIPAE